MTLAFPPGTTESAAYDINDSGQIVGSFDIASDGLGRLGFLHDGKQLINLNTPAGGTFSEALSLNEQAQVVGNWGNNVTGPIHAFFWDTGTMVNLGPSVGTPQSRAYSINDLGQVTGWMGSSIISDGTGFIWQKGALVQLPPVPGGFTSDGRGINNKTQIVGLGRLEAEGSGELLIHPFLWDQGQMTNLGSLGAFLWGASLDINDEGTIVGRAWNSPRDPNMSTGFLWQQGIMSDLNELVPQSSGLDAEAAYAINDLGQITGYGHDDSGSVVAFLLTPSKPPYGDLTGDCTVGVEDLLVLLSNWGSCAGCSADLDGDGTVGITDFLDLLANWG